MNPNENRDTIVEGIVETLTERVRWLDTSIVTKIYKDNEALYIVLMLRLFKEKRKVVFLLRPGESMYAIGISNLDKNAWGAEVFTYKAGIVEVVSPDKNQRLFDAVDGLYALCNQVIYNKGNELLREIEAEL